MKVAVVTVVVRRKRKERKRRDLVRREKNLGVVVVKNLRRNIRRKLLEGREERVRLLTKRLQAKRSTGEEKKSVS